MSDDAIAIVGAAIRAPGARDIAEFWALLEGEREGIRDLSDGELLAAGVDPSIRRQPGFVARGGVLEGIEWFDAHYFGMTSREAEIADPQQRLLLEVAVETLDDAGLDPKRHRGSVGVYAGIGRSGYFLHHLSHRHELLRSMGRQVALLNDKDYAATQISYRLDLRGPSMTVSSACSTSLLAVHVACAALLAGECDAALAGGASINVLERRGYTYYEGNIYSPDGHCRAYDEGAKGTVGGSGVGLVCLKRLEDAVRDGDRVRAVILASATNNDGANKIGMTAPSLEGQSAVIREALELSGVDPANIGYIEGHGTGTPLGDPIEVRALAEALGPGVPRSSCVLSSVKTNIGHLDTAAGIAGLIKATLAVEHGRIPGTLHFGRPSPALELENSPFIVDSKSRDWPRPGLRRAGVSSLGMGGTNVHVVLEQAPPAPPRPTHRGPVLWIASGASQGSAEQTRAALLGHLRAEPQLDLADAASTLQRRRRQLSWRTSAVGHDTETLAQAMQDAPSRRVERRMPVAMLFPGQGSQYPRMVAGLAERYSVVREAIERCVALFARSGGVDVGAALAAPDPARLRPTEVTQPALFCVQWAMAEQWARWGVEPVALAGHSIGELVAACRAGVFSLEDAVTVVGARARMMQAMPPGAMLAAELDEDHARALERPGVWLAAINGPRQVTLSGTLDTIDMIEAELRDQRVRVHRLQTSHAFHSGLLEPVMGPFREVLRQVTLQAPSCPVLSNVTGGWLGHAEATDPEYWVRQARMPVRWSTGLETLAMLDEPVLLDIGPGRVVHGLAARHPATTKLPGVPAGAMVPACDEVSSMLGALGELWQRGVEIDWDAVGSGEVQRHVTLPTYAFERRRHWLERGDGLETRSSTFERIRWVGSPVPSGESLPRDATLYLFGEPGDSVTDVLDRSWSQSGGRVVSLRPAAAFASHPDGTYDVRPGEDTDLKRVFEAQDRGEPIAIVHAWLLGVSDGGEARRRGLETLMSVARTLPVADSRPVHMLLAGTGMWACEPTAQPIPACALALGPVLSWSKERPHVRSTVVEVQRRREPTHRVAAALMAELGAGLPDRRVSLRGAARLVPRLERVEHQGEPSLAHKACVVITGGLGGLGLQIATVLRRDFDARLVLLSRSGALGPGSDLDQRQALLAPLASDDQVAIARGDVNETGGLHAVELVLTQRGWSLDGIIHAAGSAGGGRMVTRTPAEVDAVLSPKVEGTDTILAFARQQASPWIVLCGSTAALDGVAAQADYAAANAYLGALSEGASGMGSRVLAVDWGPWSSAGMAARSVRTSRAVMLDAERAVYSMLAALEGEDARVIIRASEDSVEDTPDRGPPRSSSAEAPRPIGRRETQAYVCRLWATLLGTESVEADDNFFEIGGDSLLLVEVHRQVDARFPGVSSISDLFEHPTPRSLALHLARDEGPLTPTSESQNAAPAKASTTPSVSSSSEDIAIIAMACRVPGADSPERMWANLLEGIESVVQLTPEMLRRAGVDEQTMALPDHVPADASVEGIEDFDASLFGMSPKEADLLDPQQRLLLLCAHELLEGAGYARQRTLHRIGVFCGTAMSSYFLHHLLPTQRSDVDPLAVALGNDKDFAASNLAYRFDLRGPCMAVNSACSTSLVAVVQACRALLAGDCELAVAGGARVRVPSQQGYRYRQGGIVSPDGHCRAFDHRAAGTVFGSGAGLVLLKPLASALADGDHVHAIIKGGAVTGDGSAKMSMTAPSVDGQVRVLQDAYRRANIDPRTLGLVEAHGTGTALGDPIEVEALRRVLGSAPGKHCALGAIKANLGHLDAAAGVIGLIKATLAVEHGVVPPMINYERPNPKLELDRSPLFINTRASTWPQPEGPRRAGISAFGLGGTNAHVVVEHAPPEHRASRSSSGEPHVLPLSADDNDALQIVAQRSLETLDAAPDLDAINVTGTHQEGRPTRRIRRAIVGRDVAELGAGLRSGITGHTAGNPTIVMMFPGQGAQYPNMLRGLEQRFEVFGRALDSCAEAARPYLGVDLRSAASDEPERLAQTWLTQPLMFAYEYACAELWESLGVRAEVVLGHSLGELVAAQRAGVFSLEHAMRLVCARGRVMFEQEPGSMLGVRLAEDQLAPYLDGGLDLAAVNGPRWSVLSGPTALIERAQRRLAKEGVKARPLATSHAFHSAMMDGALESLAQVVAELDLNRPRRRVLTGEGNWLDDDKALDPTYWTRQVRRTVRFGPALERLSTLDEPLAIEVGPGRTLCALLRHHPAGKHVPAFASGRALADSRDDQLVFLEAVARVWERGTDVDWPATRPGRAWHRVRLPVHPVRPHRHWIGGHAPGEPKSATPPIASLDSERAPTHPRPAIGMGYVAPRNPRETQLATIWSRCLGIDRIGVQDDFFALGGDSLMAIQIAELVHREMGCIPSTDLLIRARTIEVIVRALDDPTTSTSHSELIEMRDGTKAPLVLIHPIGGHIYGYRALVERLPLDSPVFGLRARGLEPQQRPRDSVPAMAQAYLDQLDTHGVERPWLIGSSFGGLVAYEMAARLEQQGGVPGVILLDSPGPGHMPPHLKGDATLLASLVASRRDPAMTVEALQRIPPSRLLTVFLQRLRDAGIADLGAEPAALERVLSILRAHQDAMFAYRPVPIRSPVHYFLARTRRAGVDPPTPHLAWESILSTFECTPVDGDHNSMLQPPHVDDLVRRLIPLLEEE